MPNDTAAFYLALSFLGNQQKDDAKLILQQLVDSNSSYFVPALWYLSLMLIEQAKYKEAEDLLVQVSASDHPLATRAKLLLTKLL
jgi:cytochrome c-type biogenesis protein CcmH/NrfG